MSLAACLPGLEADGTISAEHAAHARALYEELLAEHARVGSRETAEALASAATVEALERQVTRKQFLAGRTIKVRQRISSDVGRYGRNGDPRFRQAGGGSGDGGGGPVNPRAAVALIDHDPRAPYSNVEGRRKAILGVAHRTLDRILEEHSANLLGQVRKKAQLHDIVRELFGEDTGNHAAREMADAWRRTSEGLRQRFNRAGGAIGFRADWGLPQSHDWKLVRKAGFDAWRAFIIDRLAPEKMIDARTGQPMTRESLENALPAVFDTIRSNGWDKRSPGSPGAGSLANRHGDARFLVFKDAAAWSDYAREFGGGTAYDAMMGHVERMAREIAALEVLGPNPEATLRWVKDSLEQSAALDRSADSKGVGKARAAGKTIDDLWSEYTGANLEPRNEKLALVFSSWRAFKTATSLGSAYLSAFSDFGFQNSRRAFNGLGKASVIPQYLKLMLPGSAEDQKLAIRRGLIAQEASSRTAAQSRYLMEELTGEIPRRLAEGVMRVSLLARHTQTMRWVYGMESLASYTEAAGKTLAELDPKLRGALQRYGIDAAGWDTLRNAKMDVDRGIEWISPHNAGDDELASRFMEMIHEETGLAIPEADLATRAMMNSRAERGTAFGEISRSFFLFKSFGVSVLLRQGLEIAAMNTGTAARYAGGLAIATTLLGALSLQLKAIAGGKDPLPMDDMPFHDEDGFTWNPGFWGAAMLQGGGFGIFGDFLFAADARTGNGFADVAAGPMVDDLWAGRNVIVNPRKNAVREGKKFLPGGNVWYARLALDRMAADQIEQAINPDYAKAYHRLDKYAADQGTAFWWEPGVTAPDRAPDFSNALAKGPGE